MRARVWHVDKATPEAVTVSESCTERDDFGFDCQHPPHWAVTWVEEPAGQPDRGASRLAFPCFSHLSVCLQATPTEFTVPGTITVTKIEAP